MVEAGKILIIDDDRDFTGQILSLFSPAFLVIEARSRSEALKVISRDAPDLVILDLHLPPAKQSVREGMEALREIRFRLRDAIVIAMSRDEDRTVCLDAVEAGAYDFFTKPVDITELEVIVRRAFEKQKASRENLTLKKQLEEECAFEAIVGKSEEILKVIDFARKIASTDCTVLLLGESGTGKELFARAIHMGSLRKDKPFVSLNCSAIPESLLESELFGHEKGSFTGAVSTTKGKFEIANTGTLFLDEIALLSPSAQSKFLRVLEDRRVERIGSAKPVEVDIRLIAATNKALEDCVKKGEFREDLFYRINVLPVAIPPLRERKEDIPVLARHFIKSFSARYSLNEKSLSEDALYSLLSYNWPGNVRELKHCIERVLLMAEETTIESRHIPLPGKSVQTLEEYPLEIPDSGFSLESFLSRYEETMLKAALKKGGGSKKRAAGFLGIGKDRMKYLCRKYGLKGKTYPERG